MDDIQKEELLVKITLLKQKFLQNFRSKEKCQEDGKCERKAKSIKPRAQPINMSFIREQKECHGHKKYFLKRDFFKTKEYTFTN